MSIRNPGLIYQHILAARTEIIAEETRRLSNHSPAYRAQRDIYLARLAEIHERTAEQTSE